MGRQIQLYLTPADLADFETSLRSKIEFVALEYRSDGPRPLVTPTFLVKEMGKTWLTLFLARPADLNTLELHEVSAQKYWTLDVLKDPIVEFSRPYFNGTLFRRGRLYYQTGDYATDGTWVEKPELFLEWAESLFKAAKKSLRRSADLDAYLGREAWDLHSRNTAEFVAV
jgi:hypothetical protein